MRYSILKPSHPTDPRDLDFSSQESLYDLLPRIVDCESEDEAVTAIRAVYPDGVAMPVPVKLGSGQTVLLGIIEDIYQPHGADDRIPFVAFVKPHSRSPSSGSAYDRKKWAVPPKRAEVVDGAVPIVLETEFRSVGWENPLVARLQASRTPEGRLLLTAEVAGVPFSIEFRDLAVHLHA